MSSEKVDIKKEAPAKAKKAKGAMESITGKKREKESSSELSSDEEDKKPEA